MARLVEGRLAGRIALVTGAANGIGRASALRLAREGADLVVVDREGDTLQGVARDVEAAGRQVLPITADWTDAGAVHGGLRGHPATLRAHRHPVQQRRPERPRARQRVPRSPRRRRGASSSRSRWSRPCGRPAWRSRRCGPVGAAASSTCRPSPPSTATWASWTTRPRRWGWSASPARSRASWRRSTSTSTRCAPAPSAPAPTTGCRAR